MIIHGLFLEGCRWDMNTMMLQESFRGELFCQVPCIYVEPVKLENYKTEGKYMCPLYKTTDRYGQLSTTGESSNYVRYFDTPTD